MTYEKVFNDIKKTIGKVDEKKLGREFAFQMNIIGEGEGIFYIANKNGAFSVEPYDYKDNDAVFAAEGSTYKALFSGTADFDKALSDGSLSVNGNTELAQEIKTLFAAPENKAEKKVEEVKQAVKAVKAKAEPKKAAVKSKATKSIAKIEKAAEEIKSTALSAEKKVTTIAKTAAEMAKTELDIVKEAVKSEKKDTTEIKTEKLNK